MSQLTYIMACFFSFHHQQLSVQYYQEQVVSAKLKFTRKKYIRCSEIETTTDWE